MTKVKLLSTVIGVAAFGLVYTENARAALMINSQSAISNVETQSTLFNIEFNERPNFFEVDSLDRQADAFQYFIDIDGNTPVNQDINQLELIIRGGEINLAGDIRIRNSDPTDNSDPNSGGWGSIRDSVPFLLQNTSLSFSVPFTVLGDSDGFFSYNLQTTEFGGFTDFIPDQQSVVVNPLVSVSEPFSLLGLLAVGILGTVSTSNRLSKKKVVR